MEARDDRAGKQLACPRCRKPVQVPAPAARPVAPIAPKPMAVATASAPLVATPVAPSALVPARPTAARKKVILFGTLSAFVLIFFAVFFMIRQISEPADQPTKAAASTKAESEEELSPVPPDPVQAVRWRNLDELVAALKSKDADTRYQAALELNKHKTVDKAALPPLVAMLQDRSDTNVALQMRKIAARSLGKMGPDAAPAMPQLSAALGDRNGDVRSLAIDSLGMIGRPAMAPITDALRSQDGDVQMKAAAILAGFGKDSTPALATLLFFCEQADADRRVILCGYIVKIDPANQEVLKFLLGSLNDSTDNNRRLAWLALKEMGPNAESAKVQLYESYEKESNKEVKDAADAAYRRITKQE
jgi:hypothetical protein